MHQNRFAAGRERNERNIKKRAVEKGKERWERKRWEKGKQEKVERWPSQFELSLRRLSVTPCAL